MFVDTSVFVAQNFAFGGKRFTRLKRLCREGVLSLVLTDVTIRELEARIETKMDEAVRALKVAKLAANVLKAIDMPGFTDVLSKIDRRPYKESLKESLKVRLREFLDDTSCEEVGVDAASAGPVFELYFARKPPFGAEKKKHEFPDAFALAALKARFGPADQKVYVVSNDKGMREACEKDGGSSLLVPLADLDELFETVLKEEGLATEEAHQRFVRVREQLRQKAKAALENDIYVSLLDRDGDVEKVRVKDVRLGEESVVSLTDEGADYALNAQILLEADAKYPDPDFTAYDSETGDYYYFAFTEKTLHRTVEVPIDVSLCFDPDDSRASEVARFFANDGDTLWIYAEEAGWPYK